MIRDFVFGKDLTSFQALSQLRHDLLRVLLVWGVDHGVSATPHDHVHHRLHRGQRVTDWDLVDGEPRNGKLVGMISRLRGHPVRHSVVREEDDVDHVLHVGFAKAIHEVAEILVQTSETFLNLDWERSEFFGFRAQAVFVNLYKKMLS